MAEFCKECFLKLNPELSEEDLEMFKEPDLCEGCGKIVDETVLRIKKSAKSAFKNTKNISLYEFLRNQTQANELCVIRLSGWIKFTCWIDYEDIWEIPSKYCNSIVKSDSWGELPITNRDSRTINIPCHYIDI